MHERTRNSTRRMHACLGSRENRDQVPQSRRSVSAGDAPCLRTPPSARAHTSQWLAHIYIYIDRHAMTSTSTTLPVPPCPATASPPRLHASPWSPVRPPPPQTQTCVRPFVHSHAIAPGRGHCFAERSRHPCMYQILSSGHLLQLYSPGQHVQSAPSPPPTRLHLQE